MTDDVDWLGNETLKSLQRDYGNIDATIASVFLYVNRAYEAGLPEKEIGTLFENCLAKAGYNVEERETVYTLFERQSKIARQIHAGK